LDELLVGRSLTAESITGPDGLLQELTGRLVERALGAELADHLGYAVGELPPDDQSNRRNGTTPKTLATPHGEVRVGVPRDRDASFEPRIVQKHQRRFEGLDEKIIALYAGGMTTRQIERHLEQVYGVAVGRDLISRVTDAVLDDVSAWQSRPLEACYPIVWMDALVVKIRDQGRVQNHHAYLAIGVTDLGVKDVLGLWITRREGAKQWMAILTELKNRGLEDVLVCCVDGLKGFPDAIEAVWPDAIVQWATPACVGDGGLAAQFGPGQHHHRRRASSSRGPSRGRAVCASLTGLTGRAPKMLRSASPSGLMVTAPCGSPVRRGRARTTDRR
jgi:putative transposase